MPEIIRKSTIPVGDAGYKTVPCPYSKRESDALDAQMLNLQFCTCGHDRCNHSNYLGKGKDRRIILDCTKAGRCVVKGCECGAFVFDTKVAGIESNKRRAAEKAQYKVVPPEA